MIDTYGRVSFKSALLLLIANFHSLQNLYLPVNVHVNVYPKTQTTDSLAEVVNCQSISCKHTCTSTGMRGHRQANFYHLMSTCIYMGVVFQIK